MVCWGRPLKISLVNVTNLQFLAYIPRFTKEIRYGKKLLLVQCVTTSVSILMQQKRITHCSYIILQWHKLLSGLIENRLPQKQSFEGFLLKRCSWKFRKIHRNTTDESLFFNKVVCLKPATLGASHISIFVRNAS